MRVKAKCGCDKSDPRQAKKTGPAVNPSIIQKEALSAHSNGGLLQSHP